VAWTVNNYFHTSRGSWTGRGMIMYRLTIVAYMAIKILHLNHDKKLIVFKTIIFGYLLI